MNVQITKFPSFKEIAASFEDHTSVEIGVRLTPGQCKKLRYFPNGNTPTENVELFVKVNFGGCQLSISSSHFIAEGYYVESGVESLRDCGLLIKHGRSKSWVPETVYLGYLRPEDERSKE